MARRSPRITLARFAAATVLASVLTVATPPAGLEPAAAADDGSLNFTKSAPAEILHGENVTYTLTATNDGTGSDGYNLSFREVLSPDVAFVSSSVGNPTTVIADRPSTGFTTLLFENVADLQSGVTRSITITVDPTETTYPVGGSLLNSAGAYMSGDPRQIPDFSTTGSHVNNADTSAFDTDAESTAVTAIRLTKGEPNTERELLRGVHTQWTTYSLLVENNLVDPSDNLVIDDWLPAGMEFLRCGGTDNTDDTPVTNPSGPDTDEYPGAGALGVGVVPVDPTANGVTATCEIPTLVETVTLAADEEFAGQAAGVYTHVQWDLAGTMAASDKIELMYAAGIPLRENSATFAAGHVAIGDDTADLDNNSGAFTTDEQDLANWGRAEVNYNPGVDDLLSTDESNFVVHAEDLSVHKSVDDDVFTQTELPRWTMLIETGEYRNATGVVVVDTLPDGQCPLLSSGDSETITPPPVSGECVAVGGEAPEVDGSTDDPDTVVEDTDGSWTITWSTIPDLAINDAYSIEFTSAIRDFYQEAFDDDLPVVGADVFSNKSDVSATTSPITAGATELDRAAETTVDTSSAGQSSAVVSIDKSISQPTAPGVTLDCDAATWTGATPPDIDLSNVGYRPGDRVCFRVIVDFESLLHYRNPRVTDFIPAGTTFEALWGDVAANGQVLGSGPGADVTIDDVFDVEDGPGGPPDSNTTNGLTWTLGTTIPGSGTDLYVDNTADHFEVIFSVLIDEVSGQTPVVDIDDNLAKLTIQNNDNSGGSTFATRDQADYPRVEPYIVLDKRNATSGGTLDSGTETGIQLDEFDYEVEITNDFMALASPAEDLFATAYDLRVWDILPEELDCADVTTAPSLTSAEPVVCLDDGDVGYPLGGQAADGRSVFVMTVAELGPQESSILTYSIRAPALVAAGETLVNDAGVRDYEGSDDNTGSGSGTMYYPAGNIDEDNTSLENARSARDTATVLIENVTAVKVQTSSETDATGGTNRTNSPASSSQQDATIGETITYTFDVTIPQGVDVYDAVITDPLDTELNFVSLDAGSLDLTVAGPSIPLTITDPNDDGYFDVDGSTTENIADIAVDVAADVVTITFPAAWNNADGSDDDVVSLTFTAIVRNATGVDVGDNIDNRVFINWDSLAGDPVPTASSSNIRTKVVEPNPTITKSDDGTDTDAPPNGVSNVEPGEAVEHTLTVTNPDDGSTHTSAAHDLVITDVLPLGVSFDDASVTDNPDGGVFTPGIPGGTTGTITWTETEVAALADLQVGDSLAVRYTVAVDAPATAATLTNTADVDADSLAADSAGERDYNDDDAHDLDVDFPDLVIEKSPAPGSDGTDARVGENFRWRLEVFNDGSGSAFGIDVDDALPSDWLYQAGSATVDTGSGPGVLTDPSGGATGPLVWTDVVGQLDPGESFVIEFDTQPQASLLTLGTTGAFDHVNDSGVAGDDAGGEEDAYGDDNDAADGIHGSDNDTARIRRIDLEIDKSIVEPAPWFFGDFVTYRIQVTNDDTAISVDTATDITVLDALPAEVVFDSFTTANGSYDPGTDTWTLSSGLAGGASATLDIVARINAATPITNITEVEAAGQWDIDSTPGNHDGGAGPDEDDNDVVVLTPTPADLGNRLWFDVDANGAQDPGEPGIVGIDVTVSWIDPADGITTITRTTTTGGNGGYSFVDLPQDIDLTVTVDTADLPAGLVATFELRNDPDINDTQAANAEPGALDGIVTDIELTGATPSYLDVDFGFTGSGSLGDLVWNDIDADGTQGGGEAGFDGVDLTIEFAGFDGVLGDDPATLGVDESLDDASYATTTAGGGLYTVPNLPAGSYTVAVDPATLPLGMAPTFDPDGGLDRTATVTLGGGEDRTDVDFGERLEADLQITKSSDGEFAIGSEEAWTITVANLGPAVADGTITVTDTLPAGITPVGVDTTDFSCVTSGQDVSCTLDAPSLGVGLSATFDIVVDVDVDAAPSLSNSAIVSTTGGTPDPSPANDTDTDEPTVPLALLGIDKTLEGDLTSGREASWTIEVTNFGPSATNDMVTVVDELPLGLSFVRTESEEFTCTPAGQVLTCTTAGGMTVGETRSLIVVTLVTAPAGSEIRNTASVTGGTSIDGDPLPEDVIEEIRSDLDDALATELGITLPPGGISPVDDDEGSILAITGSNTGGLVAVGLLLLVVGAVLIWLPRRRGVGLTPRG